MLWKHIYTQVIITLWNQIEPLTKQRRIFWSSGSILYLLCRSGKWEDEEQFCFTWTLDLFLKVTIFAHYPPCLNVYNWSKHILMVLPYGKLSHFYLWFFAFVSTCTDTSKQATLVISVHNTVKKLTQFSHYSVQCHSKKELYRAIKYIKQTFNVDYFNMWRQKFYRITVTLEDICTDMLTFQRCKFLCDHLVFDKLSNSQICLKLDFWDQINCLTGSLNNTKAKQNSKQSSLNIVSQNLWML